MAFDNLPVTIIKIRIKDRGKISRGSEIQRRTRPTKRPGESPRRRPETLPRERYIYARVIHHSSYYPRPSIPRESLETIRESSPFPLVVRIESARTARALFHATG